MPKTVKTGKPKPNKNCSLIRPTCPKRSHNDCLIEKVSLVLVLFLQDPTTCSSLHRPCGVSPAVAEPQLSGQQCWCCRENPTDDGCWKWPDQRRWYKRFIKHMTSGHNNEHCFDLSLFFSAFHFLILTVQNCWWAVRKQISLCRMLWRILLFISPAVRLVLTYGGTVLTCYSSKCILCSCKY